jgi:apolipoprotein N-acyltransferase
LLLGLCSKCEGNWYLLDFFGLVPWLLALDRTRTMRGAAASGLAMCASFVLAIFAWFGFAIAVYSAGAAAAGLVVLLLSAPLLQPQFLAFALVRHHARRVYGPALATLTAALAWVGSEWMLPKLLADSLAQGIYPSPVLRQAADLAGTAGITFALVLVNEALAATISRRERGLRAMALPMAAAVAIIASMVGYGQWRLATVDADAEIGAPLRVGLVQSNIAAYDRLRREMGTYEAVRFVLDTHYAMSKEAVERKGVDAVMWSETVYPTTFGQPKSDVGRELDREIVEFTTKLGRPLIFGTYDLDDEGEYNSAVFLQSTPAGAPARFDVYRKSRLFLFTEYVPSWMDWDFLRPWMPWAGHWKPGPGARVLPLRLADGREVPVQPLICLDDVDAGLAVEGARLGARMLLTMSNDSWFTEHVGGAHLHLVVAAFRSIETRLPQLRVTNNGITAVIDPTGAIVGGAGVGERAVVVGDLAPRIPPRTLMVRWGDWFGRAAFFAAAALLAAGGRRPPGGWGGKWGFFGEPRAGGF